jgi:CheY-like chemotaxis protein
MRGVSAITHNNIMLRYAELHASIRRMIAVLKLRDSGHDKRIRELEITDAGIAISDSFANAVNVLSGAAQSADTQQRPVPPRASSSATVQAAAAAVAASEPQRGRVLIVDDEFGLADVVADILSERGYETAIAINGDLGLQALREKPPDLVLLDVMMPVLSGTEMLKRMKSDPARAAIPVVLMTALPREVPEDVRAQCEAVLPKPFSPDQLFQVLERVLAGERTRKS